MKIMDAVGEMVYAGCIYTDKVCHLPQMCDSLVSVSGVIS